MKFRDMLFMHILTMIRKTIYCKHHDISSLYLIEEV